MTQLINPIQQGKLLQNKKRLIPHKMALTFKCLPYDEDDQSIYVGYCDSYPFEIVDILKASMQKQIILSKFQEQLLFQMIDVCYQNSEMETRSLFKNPQPIDEPSSLEGLNLIDDSPSHGIIKMVNAIFAEAIQIGASDIHFEPSEKGLLVRYRVDGILIVKHTLSKEFESQLITRIKVLSQLDIAETRLPQDGRLKIRLSQRSVDFRVSVIPTAFGERVVLRILDKSHLELSLESLGIPSQIIEDLKEAIYVPEGMLLVTGPTGSGKTTTLYSALNKLLKDPINIMTIEDPVEFQFSGMAQISVNPKIHLTFASGLKHILRQDPDVIMIGEIRDYETAEIAIQASLTGHRVFSTLHTNDAVSAVTRLVDMGIEPYLVSSSLTGVLAQRLVRKICPSCKIQIPLPQVIKQRFGLFEIDHLYQGSGCDECYFTGYRGRIGIYEYLKINSSIRKQILKSQDADSLKEFAISQGFCDLYQQAMQLVIAGMTTIEEVLNVTKMTQ